MMTDLERILVGLFLTFSAAAFWWIINRMSSNHREVHSRIDKHIEESNNKYVRRDDFKEFRDELRGTLKAISEKIDRNYRAHGSSEGD